MDENGWMNLIECNLIYVIYAIHQYKQYCVCCVMDGLTYEH